MSAWSTWQAAARPDIRTERIEWPELMRLTAASRGLSEHTETPFVADALNATWSSRRFLTATPLRANHPCCGLQDLVTDVEKFTAERPDHAATGALGALALAGRELLSTNSELGEWFGGVACQYGARKDGRPEAVLVVPRRVWVDPVIAWLEAEDLTCVDVATPTELRTARQHLAVFVLGHPGAVYSTAFRSPTLAAREYGWLLTAPPAAIVHVGLTTDAPTLTADQVWVWPHNEAHPNMPTLDPGAVHAVATPSPTGPAVQHWSTESVPIHRPMRPAGSFDKREAAQAVPVLTAPHLTVFFDPYCGPYPQSVTVEEDGDVTVFPATLPRLAPGHVLAVRLDRPAHAALEARADQWLAERKDWSPERIAAVREAAVALKMALLWGIDEWGHDRLQQGLRSRGIDPAYARNLTHQPFGLAYIAPQRRGFDALTGVLATVPNSPEDWVGEVRAADADLVTLRVAHQQAGDLFRRDLRAQLATCEWQSELADGGWALVHDDARGTLLLTTIVGIGEQLMSVSRTWLAQAIDRTGQKPTAKTLKGSR